jgi:sugar-specific transcriptional regulator TrmB
MNPADLLQRIGLNKYEAEAYLALLAEGPLTGYELGKRSAVPLSRSYEVVERLSQRGLALVQPGDPPRYLAADPDRFLAGVRAEQAATLAALASALAELPRPDTADEFWVLRGRPAILDRLRGLIDEAGKSVLLAPPPDHDPALDPALDRARARGCRVLTATAPRPALALLLVDGRAALAGSLAPPERCQAVVGGHPALLAALSGFFADAIASAPLAPMPASPSPAAPITDRPSPLDRVAWEDRKQRRLWRLTAGGQVA